MSLSPLVSVVMPSFNQAQFLEEALRSVELQCHRPIQQIVIDGGSKDGTLELLRTWQNKDHGEGYSFEWISEPDQGHSDALNKGFDRARGEIVGWLNSDDVYFDVSAIERTVSAFRVYSEVDLVFGDVALISETSGLQMIWCFPEFKYERALRGYLFSQPTAFFRRWLIDRHRLEPTLKLAPDTALWLMMGRKARFFHICAVQAGDRDHSSRLTNTNRAALQQTHEHLVSACGGPTQVSRSAKLYDQLTKVYMRFRGLLYLCYLARDRELPKRLAFPMWVDSFGSVARRQLTMRVGFRTDMGRRQAHKEVPKRAPIATD